MAILVALIILWGFGFACGYAIRSYVSARRRRRAWEIGEEPGDNQTDTVPRWTKLIEKIPNRDLWPLTYIFIRETVHRLLHVVLGFSPARIHQMITTSFATIRARIGKGRQDE